MATLERTRVNAAPVIPSRRWRNAHPLLVAAGIYLIGVLALDHEVLANLTTATTGWISADSDTFVWWLRWLPTSIANGENPLLTNYVHYPYGVNVMWNIGVPVLGVLMLPVTLTAGPVAAYNVAMMLGLVVSGTSMAAALVPWTKRWTSRVFAGGLYAFSPFQIAHFSVGHLNLVWAILPPMLLYVAHAVFIRTPRRPVRVGVLLGIGLAMQTGIYTQTLALGALAFGIATVVVLVGRPRVLAGRRQGLTRLMAACLATYVALCAYPMYLMLFGPLRPVGAIRPSLLTRADPTNAIVPTELTLIRGASETARQMNAYAGEQGGYIGLVMLGLLLFAWIIVRTAVVRTVAIVGLVTFVFSLGPSLTVQQHDRETWLPWKLIDNVPLLSLAEPVRLQIFIAMCVATIVALVIDWIAESPRGPRKAASGLLVAVAVASWLPASGAQTASAVSPPFFATAARHLRPDDVVVTMPRPSGAWVGGGLPILWQANSNMAYRTTGGSFLSSDPTHPILYETPVNLFEGACFGLADGMPLPDESYTVAARQQLVDLGVTVVLVVPEAGKDYSRIVPWAARVVGSPGEYSGGVWRYRL